MADRHHLYRPSFGPRGNPYRSVASAGKFVLAIRRGIGRLRIRFEHHERHCTATREGYSICNGCRGTGTTRSSSRTAGGWWYGTFGKPPHLCIQGSRKHASWGSARRRRSGISVSSITPRSCADWFVRETGTNTQEGEPNHLAPPCTLSTLVAAFHTVDMFRRAAYQDMLAYKRTVDPMITPEEFRSSAEAAIHSQDIRWLLPSLFVLSPALGASIGTMGNDGWSKL